MRKEQKYTTLSDAEVALSTFARCFKIAAIVFAVGCLVAFVI